MDFEKNENFIEKRNDIEPKALKISYIRSLNIPRISTYRLLRTFISLLNINSKISRYLVRKSRWFRAQETVAAAPRKFTLELSQIIGTIFLSCDAPSTRVYFKFFECSSALVNAASSLRTCAIKSNERMQRRQDHSSMCDDYYLSRIRRVLRIFNYPKASFSFERARVFTQSHSSTLVTIEGKVIIELELTG